MFRVAVGRLAPADEAFVAHGQARAGRGGIEAVSDGRLARAQQRMLLKLARHDELARRIDLGELAVAAVGGTVWKADDHTPLAANAEVGGPVSLAVEIGGSPPALDLVGGERAEDALRRHGKLRSRNDGAPAVGHGSRRALFRSGWHSVVGLRFRICCHFASSI